MGSPERELCAIPLTYWGFFFPCLVAGWRFVEERVPGVLGSPEMSLLSVRTDPPSQLRIAGESYVITRHFGSSSVESDGPLVHGSGAGFQAFVRALMEEGPGLDAIEAIMYFVADHLSPEDLALESLHGHALPAPPVHLLEAFVEALTSDQALRGAA